MHLDGARLWNAIVATGIAGRRMGAAFRHASRSASARGWARRSARRWRDRRSSSTRARKIRKLLRRRHAAGRRARRGGLYALDNHIERLAEDHRNAQVIAQAIADTPGLRLDPPEVETNLVWFAVDPELGRPRTWPPRCKQHGVLVHAAGQTMRACTHLDVTSAKAERAAETIRQVVGKKSSVKV